MSNARNLANLLGTGTQITTADIADGVFQANRNLIINGAMQVAQRGTSFSQSPNSGGYSTVDRYSYRRNGAWSGVTAVTLTQESSGAPEGFKNFLRYAPVGSDATTPDDVTIKVQYICEGLDAAHLEWGTSNAKAVTLSFYVRSTVTGTFNVSFADDNLAATRTHQIQEYTINSANTWERKSLTFSGPTSGNWPIDNGKIFQINWIVSGDNTGGGSVTVVSPNTWIVTGTGTVITSNQTDGVTTSSGQTWDITGVQLELGDTATPFEHRSYADELFSCQRYYQRTQSFMGAGHSVHGVIGISHLHRAMRATPTLSQDGVFVVTDGYSIDATQSSTGTQITGNNINTTGYYLYIKNISGLTAGKPYMSRLSNANGLLYDAEL